MQCDDCKKPATRLTTINNEGGYGRPAWRVCDDCLPNYDAALVERFGLGKEKRMRDLTLEEAHLILDRLAGWYGRHKRKTQAPAPGSALDFDPDFEAMQLLHAKAQAIVDARLKELHDAQVAAIR